MPPMTAKHVHAVAAWPLENAMLWSTRSSLCRCAASAAARRILRLVKLFQIRPRAPVVGQRLLDSGPVEVVALTHESQVRDDRPRLCSREHGELASLEIEPCALPVPSRVDVLATALVIEAVGQAE